MVAEGRPERGQNVNSPLLLDRDCNVLEGMGWRG